MYIELESELVVFDTSKQNLEIEKLRVQQSNENKVLREEMETLKLQLANQGMEILKQLKGQGKII
jgi:hypothetical protein